MASAWPVPSSWPRWGTARPGGGAGRPGRDRQPPARQPDLGALCGRHLVAGIGAGWAVLRIPRRSLAKVRRPGSERSPREPEQPDVQAGAGHRQRPRRPGERSPTSGPSWARSGARSTRPPRRPSPSSLYAAVGGAVLLVVAGLLARPPAGPAQGHLGRDPAAVTDWLTMPLRYGDPPGLRAGDARRQAGLGRRRRRGPAGHLAGRALHRGAGEWCSRAAGARRGHRSVHISNPTPAGSGSLQGAEPIAGRHNGTVKVVLRNPRRELDMPGPLGGPGPARPARAQPRVGARHRGRHPGHRRRHAGRRATVEVRPVISGGGAA